MIENLAACPVKFQQSVGVTEFGDGCTEQRPELSGAAGSPKDFTNEGYRGAQ